MSVKKSKARYFLVSFSSDGATGSFACESLDGNFPTNKAIVEVAGQLLGYIIPKNKLAILFLYEFKNRSDYLEWNDTSDNVQVKE